MQDIRTRGDNKKVNFYGCSDGINLHAPLITNLLIFQVKLKEEEFSSQVDALRNKVEQFAVNFRLPGHSDI